MSDREIMSNREGSGAGHGEVGSAENLRFISRCIECLFLQI